MKINKCSIAINKDIHSMNVKHEASYSIMKYNQTTGESTEQITQELKMYSFYTFRGS